MPSILVIIEYHANILSNSASKINDAECYYILLNMSFLKIHGAITAKVAHDI